EPAAEFEFRTFQHPARLKRIFQTHHDIRFGYTEDGRWESITDSTGRFIRVAEEVDGRITGLMLHQGKELPPVMLLSYQYDERGNLVATRASSGHGFKCVYDANNRMIRRVGRKGFTFHFAYDATGRCVKSTGDDRMHDVDLDYDVSGRVTKV